MNLKTTASILLAACFTSCMTMKVDYEPANKAQYSNTVTININKNDLWQKGISELSKKFFVINNVDKESGLINLSYSGDPEKYVDGGIISVSTSGMGNTFTSFKASKSQHSYTAAAKANSGMFVPIYIDRKLSLEGRINVIIEKIDDNSSRVTVNIKYILTKTMNARFANGARDQRIDVTSFNTGGNSSFEGQDQPYYPTGQLEAEILQAFGGAVKM